MQVTQKVPMLANNILQSIPTTLDVKGLELNISLAGALPINSPCFNNMLRTASVPPDDHTERFMV